jgi:hypothetical protein
MPLPDLYAIQVGDRLIPDLFNARPEDIDLDGIETRLWTAHRFSNDPAALKIRQHAWLVREIARIDQQPEDVQRWAYHHDDHEGVTGDQPGPLKALMRFQWDSVRCAAGMAHMADPITRIEESLDAAICRARGFEPPSKAVRAAVHVYDKLAETIEWRLLLNRPAAPWNRALPRWMPVMMAVELVERAASKTPPVSRKELA